MTSLCRVGEFSCVPLDKVCLLQAYCLWNSVKHLASSLVMFTIHMHTSQWPDYLTDSVHPYSNSDPSRWQVTPQTMSTQELCKCISVHVSAICDTDTPKTYQWYRYWYFTKMYPDTWYLILFSIKIRIMHTCIIDTPQHCRQMQLCFMIVSAYF